MAVRKVWIKPYAGIAVGGEHRAFVGGGVVILLVDVVGIFICTQHRDFSCHGGDAGIQAQFHLWLFAAAALGVDEHHAVGAPGAVNSCG